MSKRASKLILVLLILSAATAVWIPRQLSLAEARTALGEAKARNLKLAEQIRTATTELDAARNELNAQNTSRNHIRIAIRKAESELTKVDPETRWATAPATLPDWNSESPYIWLRKDILPQLPARPFTATGALNHEVAAVLTLNETQEVELNTRLTDLLTEYHSIEMAKAEKSDEHLPGISEEKGDKVTVVVKPQPEDGKRIREQFETALRNELGSQRTDLLMQTADSWLDEQFSQSGAKPRTITIVRHPNGTYGLAIKSGGSSWFSTAGPWQVIEHNIPSHLRELFRDITPQQSEQAAQ